MPELTGLLTEFYFPNMNGKTIYSAWLSVASTTPPFVPDESEQGRFPNADGSSSTLGLLFNANSANSLYNGDKLQLSALQTLVCIKG